ncbi:Uncharacterised protein [Chromobacterium violaceum]|uniref:Uncharacterized protein n=1 Tax=Chromobacterium violaceum TaxID=536 RepID=A0A447TGN0_CHRVL|nr:Uncharacterised protein [Chromobacterium violaceum]
MPAVIEAALTERLFSSQYTVMVQATGVALEAGLQAIWPLPPGKALTVPLPHWVAS